MSSPSPPIELFPADNVEFLLELGDKFEIQYVIDECERFLMTTDDIATVTKLVWSDQYLLAKLQVSQGDSRIFSFSGHVHPNLQISPGHKEFEINRRVQEPQ